MATSRYINSPRLNYGRQFGALKSIERLREAIKDGSVRISTVTLLTGNDRLDSLAGRIYEDSRYWWVLAAASDIGWGLQVPAGTVIKIPNLQDALGVV